MVSLFIYCGAVILMLVENQSWLHTQGSYSANTANRTTLSFFDCVWLVFLSMTTIGYACGI